MIHEIKADLKKIIKDPKSIKASIKVYFILLNIKDKSFKEAKEKIEFLESFKSELVQMINQQNSPYDLKELSSLLRYFFQFYASNNEYFIEGLKFFSLFTEIIKLQEFNSIKAFLFYFAYQTKKYSSGPVKELLSQNLLKATIIDNKKYLDFCMYCFYRGIFCLEKKDFYMASYFYCTPIEIGLKRNVDNIKFLNGFNCQMIRSLCFLRYLTNFKIKECLNRGTRLYQFDDNTLIDYQDVAFCLEFLEKDKSDYKTFKEFTNENKDNINNCSLQGLKKVAEEEIIFKILKEILQVYKKIKMTKIATLKQLEVNDIMRVLKKKVLEGEINIKYDESEDIIETLDLDPGLKEKVNKTKDLYEKILEGNKNMFLNLKTKKIDQLSGKDSEKQANKIIINNMEKYEMLEDDDIPIPEDDD